MTPIYLEPDEEITSVIDKLSATSAHQVAIVVPKNSTLFQSLVNLKLLAKQAKELGKEVAVVSANKVGSRLAAQVGIQTYATLGPVKDAQPIPKTLPAVDPVTPAEPETLPDGTPVRRYVGPTGPVPVTDTPIAEEVTEETKDQPAIEEIEEGETPTESSNDEVSSTNPVAVESEKTEEGVGEVEPTNQVTPAPTTPPHHVEPDELPPIISRTPVERAPRPEIKLPWKSLVAAGVLLLIAFIAVYIFLPKATVVVTLPAKAVSQTLDLNAKVVADTDEKTITGNLLNTTKTVSKVVTATGKKDIGTKATGNITLYNKASSSSVTLSAGTTLTASSKTFTLDKSTTIPGASVSGGSVVPGQATASITASVAGDTSNLSGAQFVISGQSTLIYGTGSTTGGTTKQVTVLSQGDLDQAYTDLAKQATDEGIAEVKTKADKQTLIDGAIIQTVKSKTADKKVGEQVSSATAQVIEEFSAIVYDSTQADGKLSDSLSKELDASQQLVIPEENKPVWTFKGYSEDKQSLQISGLLNGFGVPKVNKPEIADMVKHKSVSSTESLLKSKYQATDVKIQLSPSWWPGRLPFLKQAIKVEYGFHESTEPVQSQ